MTCEAKYILEKNIGANTKISGIVGQLLYRQTKCRTIVSELPVEPAIRDSSLGIWITAPLIVKIAEDSLPTHR